MLNYTDAQRAFVSTFIGRGRSIAVGAAAVSNTAAGALSGGRYLLVTTTDTFVRQGATGVTAASGDLLLLAGNAIAFNVPADDADMQFLSLIRSTTNGTAYLIGTDEQTARAQPPAFA